MNYEINIYKEKNENTLCLKAENLSDALMVALDYMRSGFQAEIIATKTGEIILSVLEGKPTYVSYEVKTDYEEGLND